MKTGLMMQALLKGVSGLIAVMVLLFLPAGTLSYRNGWLFIALLFIPMICFGTVLLTKAPELLEKRLHTKESQSEQKLVILLSSLLFVTVFVIAGLDYRFGWTKAPTAVVVLGAVLLLAGYGLYMEVMRENAWLSRTVEIQKDQKVIDTGLYGIVRHPMYLATIILFLAMPLVLGSWISFVLMLLYPAVLVKRIAGEEKVLEEGLPGYREYKKKVKYRLFPYIW